MPIRTEPPRETWMGMETREGRQFMAGFLVLIAVEAVGLLIVFVLWALGVIGR